MEVEYRRRRTREVRVGSITLGGNNPIAVQSMITVETRNVEGCVAAIRELYDAGCELVRLTVPTRKDVEAVAAIRAALKGHGIAVPLVADVHHQGSDIAVAVTECVDKVRINPGLFVFRKPTGAAEFSQAQHQAEREAIERELVPLLEACRQRGVALRIGVNHGSLAERMTVTYGNSPEGMVESAMEHVRLCRKHNFHDVVVSLKASRVQTMLQANRLLAKRMDEEEMDYPIHLGVTEAGDAEYARIKSTLGIGTLLAEGIGDTIRVSLSEPPVNEIPVCYDILQGLGLRKRHAEVIACPSCGRTKFDLQEVLADVKAVCGHLTGVTIAVMGCIVNGPGEMADADYGYIGKGEETVALYRRKECVVPSLPQEQGVEALVRLLKEDGVWREP